MIIHSPGKAGRMWEPSFYTLSLTQKHVMGG
jgi:hypothetical protein